MSYTWKNNLACTAVYKTMERDDRMNQFEELVIPFPDGKKVKIGDLPFFPNASSGDVKLRAAKQFGGTFLKFLVNDYVVHRETSGEKIKDVFEAVVDVLKNEKKTLLDLAEVIDEKLRFEDE